MLVQRERILVVALLLLALGGIFSFAASEEPDRSVADVAQHERQPDDATVGWVGGVQTPDSQFDPTAAPLVQRPRWGLPGLGAFFVLVVSLTLFSLRFALSRIRQFERLRRDPPEKEED